MPNLNRCTFMGNLTRDPELKYTPKGTAVCNFGLAINERWTDNGEKKESTTFLDFVAFNKQAETIAQYMKKGRPLYVESKAQLDQWDDKQTGSKRSKVNFVVKEFQFLGDSSTQRESGNVSRPAKPVTSGTAELPPDTEDDVPFVFIPPARIQAQILGFGGNKLK